MVSGGVLQIAFNGLQKTTGNLTLGYLGASGVTVEMADVCQLDSRVGRQGYSRENTEALDKATGSVAGHRTRGTTREWNLEASWSRQMGWSTS